MWYNQTSIDKVIGNAAIDSKYKANTPETRPCNASTLLRVGLSTLLTITPFFYGCRGTFSLKPDQPTPITGVSQDKDAFYKHISNNTLLNNEEKSLAKRIYDFAHSDAAKYSDTTKGILRFKFNPSIFDSDLYDKWGLNKKEGLSLEEQAYVSMIKFMEVSTRVSYKINQAIRKGTLSEEQKKFLQETHERFGKGPVNLDKIPGDAHKDSKYVKPFLKALFGHKKLTDHDFLVLNEIFRDYPFGGPYPLIQHKAY